jgi:hypothetical protein
MAGHYGLAGPEVTKSHPCVGAPRRTWEDITSESEATVPGVPRAAFGAVP